LFELFFKYSRATFDRAEFLFASGWPLWLLVLLVVGGGAAFVASLIRYRQGLGIPQVATLAVLQVLMWATALVMLWRPALLSQTLRPQENSVAVLLDNSASMGYSDDGSSRLSRAVTALEDELLPELQESLSVETYAFASDTDSVSSLDALPAPGSTTHIGDGLLNVLRGSNAGGLAGIVIVTDGGDNANDLDPARLAEIASFGVPVYAVGVGREVVAEDIELEDVVVAPQGPAGSTVSAQVSIRHARGGLAQLKVYDGDAILASEPIQLPDRAGVTTRFVDLDVGEAGVRDLRFSIDALPDEQDLVNNTQLRPIEVPERRRSILYIEGEPRWEYKFMRRAIDEDGPLRVASLLRTTPNKFYRQGLDSPDELVDGFPTDAETLFEYDALIIGSYEAAALTDAQHEMIRDFVSRRGGSLLMLGGRRGLADGGWAATAVAEALPAELPDLDAPSFVRYPAKARLTDVGARSLVTRLDPDDDVNAALWDEMPELADFEHLGDIKPGADVLLEAEIQGSVEPLLVHQRFGLGNVYVLATGGTWRWQMQLPHEDQRHETFWRQLFQALATGAAQRVTLTSARPFYADESEISLRAEVKNRSFEATSDADVTVEVTHGSGATETLVMSPVVGRPGRYEASYSAPLPGVYRFEAVATEDEEELGSDRVAVRREDGIAEHFRVEQDRPALERLAAATGGRYFALADIADIPEAVQFSDAGIVERQVLDLWNMPIFFVLLLALKATEWLARLRWGRL
jgi:uncharacterized membrane protein